MITGTHPNHEGPAISGGINKDSSGSDARHDGIFSVTQLLDMLPPKELCDDLYQNFLDVIHPITPLLHIPTFHSQYLRFWQWFLSWNRDEMPSGILAETPSFLPLLFAVLFAGSFGQPTPLFNQETSEASFSAMTAPLYKLHSHALSLVAFPQSPTIYSLIAYLIAQNLLIREEESLSSCSYISVALRIAQAMGLHRDGSLFKLDPIQAEIRRRIWWHIIHTDVMTCLSSGLPPLMVVDNLDDARMISQVRDDQIGKVEKASPGQVQTHRSNSSQDDISAVGSELDDIRYVVAVGRYKLTTLMRKILRHQFDVRPKSVKDFIALKKAVDEQNTETTTRIKRIAEMQVRPTSFSGEDLGISPSPDGISNFSSTITFQNWAQKLLRLMSHKAYCILYQPLLKGAYGSLSSRVRKESVFRPFHLIRSVLYDY